MRTRVEAREPATERSDLAVEMVLESGQVGLVEVATGDARLVCHDHQIESRVAQQADRLPCPGSEADPCRVDVIRQVLDERPVLVDEHDRPARVPAAHGHDVSRIGRTVTSGMTVSGGCSSTNRIVSATLRGSCSNSGSRSGNRSSRKGVRIPPATTAVTLTPTSRASVWSAWLSP